LVSLQLLLDVPQMIEITSSNYKLVEIKNIRASLPSLINSLINITLTLLCLSRKKCWLHTCILSYTIRNPCFFGCPTQNIQCPRQNIQCRQIHQDIRDMGYSFGKISEDVANNNGLGAQKTSWYYHWCQDFLWLD